MIIVLTELPVEILEKIFVDVSNTGGSLKNLTEVCKCLNHLISSSPKLMKNLSVKWTENNVKNAEVLLTTCRNYETITISDMRKKRFNPMLMQFVMNQSKTITNIELRFCDILTSEYEKLLNIVGPNLTKIVIFCVGCRIDNQMNINKFPKLKYVKIAGDNSFEVLFPFRGTENVVEFELEQDSEPVNPFFMPFMENQKIISKISLNQCALSMSEMEGLLKLHGDKLTEITLDRLEIDNNSISYPIYLPKLKLLSLNDNISEYNVALPIFPTTFFNFFLNARNIEVLNIGRHPMVTYDEEFCMILRQMFMNCTRLKKLTLQNYPRNLFNDNFLCKWTSFHLIEVDILLHPSNPDFQRYTPDHNHIVSFLTNHKLRRVSLSGMLLSQATVGTLLRMSSLKSVTLSACSFVLLSYIFSMNYSIQELCIKKCWNKAGDGIILMLSRCSNVRELLLTEIEVTTRISKAIAEMRNLWKLEFDGCKTVVPMAYPTVTSIEFRTYTSEWGLEDSTMRLGDIVGVMRANRQLKHLKIPARIKSYPWYKFAIQKINPEILEWHDEEFRIPIDLIIKPLTMAGLPILILAVLIALIIKLLGFLISLFW